MPFGTNDTQLRSAVDLRGSETILLVDDEPMSRELLSLATRTFGYTVIEATDGADAIAQIERHARPIHLMITDVVMPKMGGVALSVRLRRWYPGARVLFMSGYECDEVAALARRDARTSFIAKPFHVNELVTAIRRVLDAPVVMRSSDGQEPTEPNRGDLPVGFPAFPA